MNQSVQAQPSPKKPFYKKWWVWTIAAVIIIAIAVGGGKDGKEPEPVPTTNTTASSASTESNSTEPKGKDSSQEKAFKVGDVVKFKESEWVVTEAKNLGNSLHSVLGDATTEGQFILVAFKITNTTNKQEQLLSSPKIIDSQGREYGNYTNQSFYLPDDLQSVALEALPAGMPKKFGAIYEVPVGAKGLRFQVRDMSAFGKKELVDLGL